MNKEKGLLREIDGIKSDLGNTRNQLQGENEKNNHILRDFNGIKEALSQSRQREQVSKQEIELANSEISSVKNKLIQANNYIQAQNSKFTNLQRDNETFINLNSDLKHQLEQLKTQLNHTQQQVSYQPPPPQFRPQPQYPQQPQYQQPPQTYYYPPSDSQESIYPPPTSKVQTFELETPTRNKAWESNSIEQNYNTQFEQSIIVNTPLKKEYRQEITPQHYDQKQKDISYQTQSFEDNQENHKNNNQSTMGSLLTWKEEEKETQHFNQTLSHHEAMHHQSTPPNNTGREIQEQTSQW